MSVFHINRRRFFSLALSLIGQSYSGIADNSITPKVNKNIFRQAADSVDIASTIIVIGDTQRTSSIERMVLGRKQNDRERVCIANEIARCNPSAMLHLGDLVCYGEDADDWQYYDHVMRGVRQTKIPVFAVPGNHDYGLIRRSASYMRSLLQYSQTPSVEFPLALPLEQGLCVLLDSNFDMMSEKAIIRQNKRYQAIIESAERNQAIQSVIVMAHHPPYSNSDLGGNRRVQEYFLPPFERAEKTKLFLSGHVHSYERFYIKDKHYVVSGGGGGPQRAVRIDTGRPYHTDMYRDGEIRPFHFLSIKCSDRQWVVSAMMLNPTTQTFYVGDRFTIFIA